MHASQTLVRYLTLGAIALVAASCSGSDGPVGPAGPTGADGPPGMQGPEGPQGPQGNANAWIYEYGPHDFSTNAEWTARFDDVSEEEALNSAWLVYLVGSGGLYFQVPGQANGPSEYQVMHYWINGDLPPHETYFQIRVQLLAGHSGSDYIGVRVIRIAATPVSPRVVPGVRRLPEWLDLSDYEAVVGYAGLAGVSSEALEHPNH